MGRRRSIILGGKTTSISMEEGFWRCFDRLAREQGMAWQEFMRFVLAAMPEPANRAAAVKEYVLEAMARAARDAGVLVPASRWRVTSPVRTVVLQRRGVRLTVGRAPGNAITIEDGEVSRRHALLVFDDETWWALDLESKNGLFFRSVPVVACRLRPNDPLRLGASSLTFLGFDP